MSLDDIAVLDEIRRAIGAAMPEALAPLARELVELRKLRDQERHREPTH